MSQSSDFGAVPLAAAKQSDFANEKMQLNRTVRRTSIDILQPEEESSKKPKFGGVQLTAAKQPVSTADFQQCEFEQFRDVLMGNYTITKRTYCAYSSLTKLYSRNVDNVITFSRCEAKPFVSTEPQIQQMVVNELIFMTVVSLSFQRCYKANDLKVKIREPNGKGPRIAIQVFLAMVKQPDIRTPAHWRDLNLVFHIHDNGVRFDIEELYFSAKGDIVRRLDNDWSYIASILQGTIKYLSMLYDCPGYEKPMMIFWELTTKSHPLEECFLVMQQCASNKRMKTYVKEVLNQSQGASLYGYIC